MSTLHSKLYFIYDNKKMKNPKIAWQNPQIPSWPPNSQDLGKNPKQWERWLQRRSFALKKRRDLIGQKFANKIQQKQNKDVMIAFYDDCKLFMAHVACLGMFIVVIRWKLPKMTVSMNLSDCKQSFFLVSVVVTCNEDQWTWAWRSALSVRVPGCQKLQMTA